MVEASRGAEGVLAAAVLGGSGVLLAAGGLLHPHVPAAAGAQMEVLAGNERWLRSHWTLTLAQPLAILGVLLLADRWTDGGRSPAVWGGAALAGAGFLVGTLGTLSAATALPTAAEAGDRALFTTVNAATLGLGWLCIVVTAAGGLLFGAGLARADDEPGGRWLGTVVAGLSLVLLLATAIFEPSHPWTHDLVLRATAIVVGLVLLVVGAWLGRRSLGRSPSGLEEA